MTAMLPRVQRLTHSDFTSDLDATTEELSALLDLAADVKLSPERYRTALAGKSAASWARAPAAAYDASARPQNERLVQVASQVISSPGRPRYFRSTNLAGLCRKDPRQ